MPFTNSPKYSSYLLFSNVKLRPLLRGCVFFLVVLFVNINVTLLVIRLYGYHPISESPFNKILPNPIVNSIISTTETTLDYSKKDSSIISTSTTATTTMMNINNNSNSNNQAENMNDDHSQVIEHIPILPNFSSDGSDYILGSIIERSFDSYGPYVTTFFLSHQMLQPYLINNMGAERVNPTMKKKWKETSLKFQSLEYDQSGQRATKYQYSCILSNSMGDILYSVPGRFLPNRLVTDVNSNRRVDILRCPIKDVWNATKQLQYSHHELQVEILCDRISLIKFSIPWKTRRTGYMLFSPSYASKINAWENQDNIITNNERNGRISSQFTPIIHLSMPGSRLLPTKKNLALIVEYISHHLLIGFEHIYFTIAMNWNSDHMNHFLQFVRTFIEEGKLTITSNSYDPIDSLPTTHGLQWQPVAVKTFQTSMFLFYTKGFADYLAVLDVDEFFIPKGQYSSIVEIIRNIDYSTNEHQLMGEEERQQQQQQQQKNVKGTKGYADGHDHPFCFILIQAEVVARTEHEGANQYPWIGSRFSHGSEYNSHNGKTKRFAYDKAIYPTRKIYQAGVGNAGACKLHWKWTPCSHEINEQEFCEKGYGVNDKNIKSQNTHRFDEIVITNTDSKTINPWNEAVVYHYMIYHDEIKVSIASLMNSSDYTEKYYPNVLRDLKERELEFILSIPEVLPKMYGNIPSKWTKLFSKNEIEESQANQPSDHNIEIPISMTIDSFPPLPKNFSTRVNQVEVELPDFTIDYTDFILSSMIERESGSYQLYLTTFFLCHSLLEPQVGASAATAENIHPSVVDVWKKAMRVSKSTLYTENGERQQPPRYFCKITHSMSSTSYYAKGRFVPNRLTPDSNSNRRLDILRCPMQDTKDIYSNLNQLQDQSVVVELYRGTEALIKFRIPWKSRMTGYMLSEPDNNSNHHHMISNYNPWHGVDMTKPPELWHHDRLYMCVPGLESAPDRITLPLYLEFVEHHLQLGVDRIFIVAALAWDGKYMNTYLRIFEDYIKEGRVSIQSSSYDNYDLVYSTGGLQWGRDNVKNFYVNMCTYFNKGVADYIGVWDFDELFTPMGKYQNILDVIDMADVSPSSPIPYFHSENSKEEELQKIWKGGRGLADGDGHPLCFITFNSLVTLREKIWQNEWDYSKPWIGQRFSHGPELTLRDGKGLAFVKTIRPTRTAFQGGMHHIGACRLPSAWDGCKPNDGRIFGTCYSENGQLHRILSGEEGAFSFHKDHKFDEVVLSSDAKEVKLNEAYINHIQFHRVWFGATTDALHRKSDYSVRYFDKVFQAIDSKGLELPISLPEKSTFITRNDKQGLLSSTDWIPSDFLLQPKPMKDIEQQKKDVDSENGRRKDNNDNGKGEDILLPHMTEDSSELILASMIDGGYITIYFLSHTILSHESMDHTNAKDHILGIHRKTTNRWQIFLSPSERHPRSSSTYSCILQNNPSDESYEVSGEWIEPTIVSTKTQVTVDMMRCPIHVPIEYQILDYYRMNILSNTSFSITLKRGDDILMKYIIPWQNRVHSYSLESIFLNENKQKTSHFNPWKGVIHTNPIDTTAIPLERRDKIYMIISGYDITPARQTIGTLLESIQHHLLLGIDHIFLSVAFTKDSIHMIRLERMLRSYIIDQKLSIFSQTIRSSVISSTLDSVTKELIQLEGMDFIYGNEGLAYSYEIAQTIQNELFVAYLHSQVEYIAIWNIHDFLMPVLASIPHSVNVYPNIKEILDIAETKGLITCIKDIMVNGRNATIFAGVSVRYPCMMSIALQTIHSYYDKKSDPSFTSYWHGDQFSHLPESNGYSIPTGDSNKIFRMISMTPDMNNIQAINHNSRRSMVLYFYRFDVNKIDDRNMKGKDTNESNHYYNRYYSHVKRSLYERKLDLMIDIPLRVKKEVTANQLWTDYFKAWDDRDK